LTHPRIFPLKNALLFAAMMQHTYRFMKQNTCKQRNSGGLRSILFHKTGRGLLIRQETGTTAVTVPEVSLLCLQEPIAGPCPEPDKSSAVTFIAFKINSKVTFGLPDLFCQHVYVDL
jgi:hypothetical protein